MSQVRANFDLNILTHPKQALKLSNHIFTDKIDLSVVFYFEAECVPLTSTNNESAEVKGYNYLADPPPSHPEAIERPPPRSKVL